MISAVANSQRKMQMLMRVIAQDSITDRDRLLFYTIGEFYNEMSLYIEQQELRKKAIEESKRKAKK
jgi:hypothetical protein